MHFPRRQLTLTLSALALASSCFRGARAPEAEPRGTLALSAQETSLPPSKRPFGVVFASPKGQLQGSGEISIVFNRPMRALELAGAEAASPATVAAADGKPGPGVWRWMGTSALAFIPETALRRATAYHVKVPAGTKSLAGDALAAAFEFDFQTPRPSVARVYVAPPDEYVLKPSSALLMRLGQPTDLKQLQAHTVLRVAGAEGKKTPNGKTIGGKAAGPALGFALAYEKNEDGTTALDRVRLTPNSKLALATEFEVAVDEHLQGSEGALEAGEPFRETLTTYKPQALTGFNCSQGDERAPCSPGGSVYLSSENPMTPQEWYAHLRVEPALKLTPPAASDKYPTSSFRIPGRMHTATAYRVTLTAGARDVFDQTLSADAQRSFRVGDERPSMIIGVEGQVFERKLPASKRMIPIGTVNYGSYELVTASLDEATVARLLPNFSDRVLASNLVPANLLHRETVPAEERTNVQRIKQVSIDAVTGNQPGVALIVVGGEARPQSRLLRFTDLAITAKASRFGTWVWVTHLSDASFVAGATVSVRDDKGVVKATAKTDATGLARFAPTELQPVDPENGQLDNNLTLFARADDDFTYHRLADQLDSWDYASSTSVELGGKLSAYGMLFTDRGVYRPGETIHVKGLFRQALVHGVGTPEGRKVKVTASDNEGDEIFSKEATLGAFGDLAVDVVVPESAAMGDVSVHAVVARGTQAEDGGGAAYAHVMVGAYKPAEFKVGIEADKSSFTRGDTATFTARGDFLFGAPMSGGAYRVHVTRSEGSFSPPNHDDYAVADPFYVDASSDAAGRSSTLTRSRGTLSANGQGTASIALSLPGQHGAELVTAEAEIEDLSRQTQSADASVIVHPGDFYMALKSPTEWIREVGKPVLPEVLAVTPKGEHVAGVATHIELFSRTWNTTFQDDGDRYRGESKPVDSLISACDLTTAQTPASCSLPVTAGGFYFVRATGKDKRGNRMTAAFGFYASSDSASVAWPEARSSKLDLVADKAHYELGETARIIVKSPFREAEALITVERAGIYTQTRTKVFGSMPVVRVPITEDMRPNAFVSIQLFKARTSAPAAKGPDLAGPAFRLGYLDLAINPEAKRLKVKVQPARTELRPGQELDVDLDVRDRQDKAALADVTFYAVDEGVLMLTGYKTPDPVAALSQRQPSNVANLESRTALARLIDVRPSGMDDKGGDGGDGGGGSVRKDFRPTAYFGTVRTDAAGKARVHFKLPDSLTTYRLMAVAATKGEQVGFGESRVITSRELLARPAMPRFVRAGDTFEAGVVVTAKGFAGGAVKVHASASGGVSMSGEDRSIQLAKGESAEVRFAFAATTVGKATFNFRVEGAGARDDVSVTREVSAPTSLEAVALYGETENVAAEKLGSLAGVRADVGTLDLRVSSTALVGLDNGVEQLLDYPYGCTEQLTSRLLPLVAFGDLAKAYNLAIPKDASKLASIAVAKILERQGYSGGFGYWNSDGRPDPWVSAYALFGLHQAAAHGIPVRESALEGGKRWLTRFVVEPSRDPRRMPSGKKLAGAVDRAAEPTREPIHDATAALVLDVLAVTGSADAGGMNILFEARQNLPLFAKGLLLHAMALGKMRREDIDTLAKEVESNLRISPTGAIAVDGAGEAYGPLLDSSGRTMALVLRGLLAADPQHALGARLAKAILAARSKGSWRSTQEAAWALLALDDYRRLQEAKAPAFNARVFFGKSMAYETEFKSANVRADHKSFRIKQLLEAGDDSRMTFQAFGSGHLFYEARLRYARTEMPKAPLDRGFYVQKYLRAVGQDELRAASQVLPKASASSAVGGNLVLVDLFVVTPDPRMQVVIEDPLPAGLEAVDSRLGGRASSEQLEAGGGNEEEGSEGRTFSKSGFLTAYAHQEVRDDRVLFFAERMQSGAYHFRYVARATTIGKFVLPPTRVECMYEPETFGRTAAANFEVTAVAAR